MTVLTGVEQDLVRLKVDLEWWRAVWRGGLGMGQILGLAVCSLTRHFYLGLG